MKEKSLKKNAILNTIKTIMSMAFPLITFPYVSRILQIENIGKVSFSLSIVNYFVLLAGLGIKTYAIREGSRVRDCKEELTKFSSEVFTINMISTAISYILLIVITFGIPTLRLYIVLIFVQSFNIIGTTIGIEWIYSIKEDYFYITTRTLFVQLLSLILLFTLVHSVNDYIIYAGISVFATTSFNIFNFFHARKIIKIKFTWAMNIKNHLSPIMMMFAMSVATTIYVNSDTTMLGFMIGDYYVGIYNTATKIYTILKSIISASILIALPRLSNYIALENKDLYQQKSSQILNTLIMLLLPVVVGTFMVATDIINLLAGDNYLEAVPVLRILCISLIFSTFAIYMTNVVLLPMKKEKQILYATVVSAAVNFLLNFYFIPVLHQNGAAITTVIAEFIVLAWQFIATKERKLGQVNTRDFLSVLIGCSFIVVVCKIITDFNLSFWSGILLKIGLSAIVYGLVLLITKHKIMYSIIKK